MTSTATSSPVTPRTLHTAPSSSPTFFFFNDTATPDIYTLSLHDALPISSPPPRPPPSARTDRPGCADRGWPAGRRTSRSEEHTSELQSRRDLVCRLLLEKKNKIVEK